MTCIVGLVQNGCIVMGADSAGVSGYDMRIRRDRKIFKLDDMVVAFTSSFRMGQLLGYGFTPPFLRPGVDVMTYMVTEFIDAVRVRLKAGGFASLKDNAEAGGIFLVGFHGRIFCIQSDYQVSESVDGYDAQGCGESFALGSLRSTRGCDNAQSRVTEALETAAAFSAGVRAPFHYESLGV